MNPPALSTKTQQLLDRLEYFKAMGPGKGLSHSTNDDRSPSLAIREADDQILIHCFSGCGVSEILSVVGLQKVDLFPDQLANPYASKPRFPKLSAYGLFPVLVQGAVILALAWIDTLAGKIWLKADHQRAQQSFQRVMRLHTEVSI